MDDALASRGVASSAAFAGDYAYETGPFVDFESLRLEPDGRYEARVEATLVNPAVRTFRGRCLLPEIGTWNAFRVGARTRLRVVPTTSRPRVYEATLAAGVLSLTRFGVTARLVDAEHRAS